jgi:hypothetical protein
MRIFMTMDLKPGESKAGYEIFHQIFYSKPAQRTTG